MNFFQKWLIEKRCAKGLYPPFVRQYYEAIFQKKDKKNTPFEDARYVIIDTETTGLDSQKSIVLSIGAVAIRNKRIFVEEGLEIVLNATQKLEAETVKIHGLTMQDITEGVSAIEAAGQFLKYLETAVIVAHHADFDVQMLEKTISEAIGMPFRFDNWVIDTVDLAMRLDAFDKPYSALKYDLDSLCRRYDIAVHDRHTAWGDAFITAELFLILSRKLENKGFKKLKDWL
jgi:DNA polymerase III subunit epsilon